jgi:Tfp pilus assembly protein PilZ
VGPAAQAIAPAAPPSAAPASSQLPIDPARELSRPAAGPPGSAPSTPNIDVELGTHSSSNFYKGLGGNDVIEHGGIFVATYKVPKIGELVNLRVLLPGDYEFQAVAAVQWTREGRSTEPGFGARFTQISPEGRQLVYRYTRNREPMFYDDL